MWGKIAIVGFVAAAVAAAAINNVSDRVEPAQRAAAYSLMQGMKPAPGFDGQVAFITAVQDRILKAAPSTPGAPRGIPLNQPRELTDVIKAGYGLCFDRSRAIETVLRAYGFEARHISVFSTAKTHSALKSLLSAGTPSHVVTEVRTDRGWLLVDPNRRWIGLTVDGKLATLDHLAGQHWRSKPMPILGKPFIYVRGLYSRHGRFYPPYDPIPDVSWPEVFGV
jgi:hypothetical protein